MMQVRSHLAHLHTTRRTPEQVRRDGWREQRVFAIAEDDPRLTDGDRIWIRQMVKRLGWER